MNKPMSENCDDCFWWLEDPTMCESCPDGWAKRAKRDEDSELRGEENA
jgi:hypothetical protein